MSNPRTEEVISLMQGFAERTGLVSGQSPRRYLWTDAFAVCNLLGLSQASGEQGYTELALRLVDQVHHTLGRHRQDDPRSGWLSGLSEQEGERHPTRGGLRIGKALPERGSDEPFDERLEWDRDGQYFHYLTKWMHALDQVTRATAQPRYNVWARELAERAVDGFTYLPTAGHPRRMYWKMSIDLTRPLVSSMGQHDPLDGYITCLQLLATTVRPPESDNAPMLTKEIGQFAAMIKGGEWTTADPLGIGGLLADAYRMLVLLQQKAVSDEQLLEALLSASLAGLRYYARSGELRQPAEYRLAFRELGLAIGLHAAERIRQWVDNEVPGPAANPELRALVQALIRFAPMREEIESFWRNPGHQRADTWSAHRDINEVMLATSLLPEGFLVPRPTG